MVREGNGQPLAARTVRQVVNLTLVTGERMKAIRHNSGRPLSIEYLGSEARWAVDH
jgi:hypothetical protein